MLYKELTTKDKLAIARAFTSNLLGISTLKILPLNAIGVYFIDSNNYFEVVIKLTEPLEVSALKHTNKLNVFTVLIHYNQTSEELAKVKAIMSKKLITK